MPFAFRKIQIGEAYHLYCRMEATVANGTINPSEPARRDPTRTARRSYWKSLRFEQIDSRHATIKPACSKTCAWILEHEDYKHWLDPATFHQHHGFFG